MLACDLGKPPLSSTVTVTVRIMDENDNSPVFIFPNDVNNTVTVPHTLSPNTTVTSLQAYDVDLGRNGELVFSLGDLNGTRFFDVKPTTGEVRFLHGLSDSQPFIYYLFIHSFIYPFSQLAIHPFILLASQPFLQPASPSFIHSSIHSASQPVIYLFTPSVLLHNHVSTYLIHSDSQSFIHLSHSFGQ